MSRLVSADARAKLVTGYPAHIVASFIEVAPNRWYWRGACGVWGFVVDPGRVFTLATFRSVRCPYCFGGFPSERAA